MNILHVVDIDHNKANGINDVIPKYLNSQVKYAKVAIYNYCETDIVADDKVLKISSKEYPKGNITLFPEPFNHPDLVILHDIFCNLNFIKLAKQLQEKKIPYVIVPHGCFSREALNRKKLKKAIAIHTIYHNVIYKAVAVQYLCETERQNSPIKQHSIVASNGVMVSSLVHEQEAKKEKRGKRFIFVGRKDIHHKGIDYLLEGCFFAKETLIKYGAKVSLYGPDSKGGSRIIESLIKKYGLESVVENKEAIFDQEKIKELRSSDVFILTSRFEGQPLAILEALANGLPVLVTPGTGFAEEVSDNHCGWQVNLDSQSIGEKLCEIVTTSNTKIKEYGENAYQYVKEVYNWDKVARSTILAYEKIVEERVHEAQ